MKQRWAVFCLALVALVAPANLLAGGDWNDAGIQWLAYDEGLKAAAESGKPVCLVFFTEWCPHCTKYAEVFHDSAVVERSKSFVMVRLDRDQHKELSGEYAPDGQYIPRTYFLSAQGELDASLQAPRDQYRYFYHESDPADLLQGMERALGKLAPKSKG